MIAATDPLVDAAVATILIAFAIVVAVALCYRVTQREDQEDTNP